MGQVALGLRSLLFKAGIFFVMAALLAWALGGTLWPRDEVVDFEGVRFDGRDWFWRLVVRGKPPEARWQLMVRGTDDEAPRAQGERQWVEVSGPRVSGARLVYAGKLEATSAMPWRLVATDGGGEAQTWELPDRLAVEQQLARLEAGLPVQDDPTIRRQRSRVLDPSGGEPKDGLDGAPTS